LTTDPGPPARAPLHRLRRVALIALAAMLVLTAWGFYSRMRAQALLRTDTARLAEVTVSLTRPTRAAGGGELVLPGDVQAYADAAVYARTSGYLRRRLVDIGQSVRAGQLLAEIDAPEVDAQLRQAQADRANAATTERLARETAERWQALYARGVVAKQDVDDRTADAAAKRAALESAQANLARLRDLTSFKRVVAPFDGVVTARSTEVGALINAGSGSGVELFHIAATRRLRVQVRVPEGDAAGVRIGTQATLGPRDRPEQRFAAIIARTARAIDPVSRTLLVELEVDNRSGALLPGSYAQVRLPLSGSGALRLPAAALQFRSDGIRVATLGAGDAVVFRSVELGRDLGREFEVLGGIGPDDRVVLDPPDSLAEGERVRVRPGSWRAGGSGG